MLGCDQHSDQMKKLVEKIIEGKQLAWRTSPAALLS